MAGTPEKLTVVDQTATDTVQAANNQSAPPPVVTSTATSTSASGTSTPELGKTGSLSGASGYTVQVAAVSKQEDADALVDALKKKSYPVFIANAATDKLFHVQVGPFGDIKDAEAMKSKLMGDGYNPIVKR